MAGARTGERNELILQNAHLTHAEIARLVHSTTGQYVTPNAVNIVITRAKSAGDRRVLGRKSRRGRKGASPFNNWMPVGRAPASRPRPPPPSTSYDNAVTDIRAEPLPRTARLLLNTTKNHCKFPLRDSGISLIVCAADVGGRGPYCPICRERAFIRSS
jgi:hypothetical protein